jgi:GNAT superfamily N-acetyltransferase
VRNQREQNMKDGQTSGSIRYRRMTAEDLPAAHKLSLAVLWPHRLEDWKFIHAAGAGLVAEDGSALVGAVMRWIYGDEFASIGMMIVSPDRQRQGIGRELMSRTLEEVGGRNVLLYATQAGVPFCEPFGFTQVALIHQHQGTVFRAPFIPLAANERMRPVGPRDDARLGELASRALGFPRDQVVKQLLKVADCVAIDHNDELIGFAAVRKFGHGYVIGPVVAPDAERAKALIAHWAGAHAGSFVRVDVPGDFGLSPWLTELGMVQVEKTVPAMVRGERPRPDGTLTQFALLNQALG